MEKCDVIQDLLPLYIDNVVSDGSRELVDEHLKDCPACREIMAKMKDDTESTRFNTDTDDVEIGVLKRIKRKMRRKNFIIACISVACTIAVLCVLFIFQVNIPYDTGSIFVGITDDGLLSIHSNGFDTFRGMLVEDEFYFYLKGTLITRLLLLDSNRMRSVGRYAFYDIGEIRDGRNDWTTPQGMYINVDDINRIFYLRGDFNKLMNDEIALERAKENAVLVWER